MEKNTEKLCVNCKYCPFYKTFDEKHELIITSIYCKAPENMECANFISGKYEPKKTIYELNGNGDCQFYRKNNISTITILGTIFVVILTVGALLICKTIFL